MGAEIQTTAAVFSLLKVLFGNETFLVAFCICGSAMFIVPSVLAFKAIKILSAQITPLREEIASSSKSFTTLIGEIREQRRENIQIINKQNELVNQVIDLVERVTRRLSNIEKGKN